jgi:hypothetical protein
MEARRRRAISAPTLCKLALSPFGNRLARNQWRRRVLGYALMAIFFKRGHIMTFKHTVRTTSLSMIAASICAALPIAAYSQAEPGPQQRATQPAEPADPATTTAVPQQKIEKFADAYVAVQKIQVKAQEKLQASKDADEAQQVKTSAEGEMIQAVEKTGLNVDEFNQIVQAMASDVSLRSKVNAEIQKRS